MIFIFLGVVIFATFYGQKLFLISLIFFIFVIVYSISTKSHFFNIGKRLLALSSNLLKDITVNK